MSHYTGEPHKRTLSQNNALHLYYEHLARELNDSGWTIQKFLKHAVEINWTKDLVKELLWRPVQEALTQKKSTTKLDKVSEIDLVYDHITRHVGELCGIYVPFPARDKDDIAPLR